MEKNQSQLKQTSPDVQIRFRDFLKTRHLRKTPERMAILDAVMRRGSHFEVDEIYNSMDAEGYHVSRVTVYSTIDLLCQCGIIRRLLFDTHQAYYEVTGKNHIHLVCMECGRVREAEDPAAAAGLPQMRFSTFAVAYCSTTVYGVCSRCQKRARAAARENKRNS